jgi:optic atrophy protein 1
MAYLLRLLRLRYLIFGTAVGGGYAAHKKYKDIKDALPDLSWMKEYMPDETVDALTKHLSDLANSVSLPDTTHLQDRVRQLQDRFSNYLSTATPNKNSDDNEEEQKPSDGLFAWTNSYKNVQLTREDQERLTRATRLQEHEYQEKIHQEMMNIQIKYQREIDRLEKEIKTMKKQILLRQEKNLGGQKQRKLKRSLIDMYSDVLDELNEYDTNYNIQDHLPRVKFHSSSFLF